VVNYYFLTVAQSPRLPIPYPQLNRHV
jgi:hypothetical protein